MTLLSRFQQSVGLECDGDTCLGVIDGTLKFCPPGGQACVSSQDDRPPGFTEPWDWSDSDETPESAKNRLEAAVLFGSGLAEGESVSVLQSSPRYLHVLVTNKKSGAQDDMEFFLPKNDVTVQLRASRRSVAGATGSSPVPDFGANARRLETIRKSLKWTKIPVLRNRRRTFVFLETPFDTFGPVTGVDPETGGTSADDYAIRGDTDPLSSLWKPATPEMRQLKKHGD